MTQRHRRNPDQVTRDRLEAKLRGQKRVVAEIRAALEHSEGDVARTEEMLRLLGTTPLPGFEQVLQPPDQEPKLAGLGKPQIVSKCPGPPAGPPLPPATCPWHPGGPPHQHRQISDGIGECLQCVEEKA